MDGFISNIQPFSLQDGPGIRTTVFMKGCNLRCFWCHNPEALSPNIDLQFFEKKCIGCGACVQACPYGDISLGKHARFTEQCLLCGKCADACYAQALVATGRRITVEAFMTQLIKDQEIFQRSGGGVTFSGGEPLMQADFLKQVMQGCKKAGISVAIETALNIPTNIVLDLLPYIDFFICDLKTCDAKKHFAGTGADNKLILENIRAVAQIHPNVLIRTPIIPGFNATQTDMQENVAFLRTLPEGITTELLPFHGICENKYQSMNLDYAAKGKTTPDNETMSHLAGVYIEAGLNVKY